MNKRHKWSKIKFIPKTSEHKHYVKIVNNGGCYTYIGDVRSFESPQILSIAPQCQSVTIIVHLLSSLGGIHHYVKSIYYI